jgi:hypothetical protein
MFLHREKPARERGFGFDHASSRVRLNVRFASVTDAICLAL